MKLYKDTFEWGVLNGLMSSHSNLVLIGLPIVLSVCGADGVTSLILLVSIQSPYLFTLSTILLSREGSWTRLWVTLKTTVWTMVQNPIVLSLFLGICLSAMSIEWPQFLETIAKNLGDTAGPLGLFIVGANLAFIPMRQAAIKALPFALLKLLVHPLLFWGIGKYIFDLPSLALTVGILAAGMPNAVVSFLFSQSVDKEQPYTAATIFLTTTLSIFSLGLILASF